MSKSYDDYVKHCEILGTTPVSTELFLGFSKLFDTLEQETTSAEKEIKGTKLFSSNVWVGDFVVHKRSGMHGNVIGVMVDEFNDVWALVETVVSGSELPKSNWFRVELLKVEEV